MSNPDHNTPEEWGRMLGITVMDPDGWRIDGKDFEEPIGISEFMDRSMTSTIMIRDVVAFTEGVHIQPCERRCELSGLPAYSCHHCQSGEPNLGYYGTPKRDEIESAEAA